MSLTLLQSIRDRTQGWIAGIIVSLLILSFALWGIHSYIGGGGGTAVVAKVNNVEITTHQLNTAYERLRRQLQHQLNSSTLPPGSDALLKERALHNLIEIQVLQQASLDQDYRITTRQVDLYLESMPDFQVNNQFSMSRFQQLIAASLFTPVTFLELIHASLLIDQPRLGILLSSFALPNETFDTMRLLNQERNISYVTIPYTYFLNQSFTIPAEKINAYYKEHEQEFKTAEQASIEYVALSLKDLSDKLAPTDAQLKSFYNDNINSFSPKNLSFEQTKNKVKQMYVHQQSEEKFAELKEKLANAAYEHPDSLEAAEKVLGVPLKTSGLFTKDKGGADEMTANAKVREIAFSNDVLNQKNNSDVIQLGNDRIVVLRIKDYRPAKLLSVTTVEPQIREKLKTLEAWDKTAELAKDIKLKLEHGMSLQQMTNQFHFPLASMGMMNRHSKKVDSAVLNTAFALPKPDTKHPLSFGVVKVTNGYAVVVLHAVKEGNISQDPNQYKAFADQIQNSEGLLEYELYKAALMKKAKITVEEPK